jgi:hypothetical protein
MIIGELRQGPHRGAAHNVGWKIIVDQVDDLAQSGCGEFYFFVHVGPHFCGNHVLKCLKNQWPRLRFRSQKHA